MTTRLLALLLVSIVPMNLLLADTEADSKTVIGPRNVALAEADVIRGQELSPNAKNLKIVKGMLLDETNPVSPNIVIDDRRGPVDDEN